MKFYASLFGFVLGVFFHSFFSPGTSYSFFLLLMSGTVLVYFWNLKRKAEEIPLKLFVGFIFIFAFSLGMLRYDFADRNADPLPRNLIGQHIYAEGIISDEPDERENNTKLTILLDTVGSTTIQTKILASVARYSRFVYGDRVKLSGVLTYPENFAEDNGKVFDYVSYLAKDGIVYLSKNPKLELVSYGGGNFLNRNLFAIKSSFIDKIESSLPSPQSSLLGGLLLGAKRALGKDLQEEFRRAGVIHVVVLSGYNVTIVADAIMKFFSFLPRAFSISFGAGSIVLFALMTGASATTVRSSIMAIFALLARWIGRKYDIVRALLIAGLLMIIHNPKILVFDISFQLSFLSTLALIYVSPLFQNRLKFLPEAFKIREIVISTLSTQIFVLPFLIYTMGDVSLVGLPVNILILGFIPLTMFLGFLTGIFSYLGFIFAFPFAFLSNILLSYELKIVHLFSSLPFASVSVSSFSVYLMTTVYIFYGFVLYKFHTKEKPPSPFSEKSLAVSEVPISKPF